MHEELCRCVIELIRVDGANNARLVDDLCEIRQQLADPLATLAVTIEP